MNNDWGVLNLMLLFNSSSYRFKFNGIGNNLICFHIKYYGLSIVQEYCSNIYKYKDNTF